MEGKKRRNPRNRIKHKGAKQEAQQQNPAAVAATDRQTLRERRTASSVGRGGQRPGSRSSGAERGRDPGMLAQAVTPRPSGWRGGSARVLNETDTRLPHTGPDAVAHGRSRPRTRPSCKADEGGSLGAPHTHRDVTGSVSICSTAHAVVRTPPSVL